MAADSASGNPGQMGRQGNLARNASASFSRKSNKKATSQLMRKFTSSPTPFKFQQFHSKSETQKLVNDLLQFINANENNAVNIADIQVEYVSSISRTFLSAVHVFDITIPMPGTDNKVFATFKRSLKEVETLQKELGRVFVGAFIPPLVTKIGKTGSFSHEASLDRKTREALALKLFFACLLRHPFLASSKIFREFTNNNKGTTVEMHAVTSDGVAKWERYLDLVYLPDDSMLVSKGLNQELQMLLAQYKQLKKDLSKFMKLMEQQSRASADLKSSMTNWVSLEGSKLVSAVASAAIKPSAVDASPRSRANSSKSDLSEHAKIQNLALVNIIKANEVALGKEESKASETSLGLKTLARHDVYFEICILKAFQKNLQKLSISAALLEKAANEEARLLQDAANRKQKIQLQYDINKTIQETRRALPATQGYIPDSPNHQPDQAHSHHEGGQHHSREQGNASASEMDPALADLMANDEALKDLNRKLGEAKEVVACETTNFERTIKAVLVVELNRFCFERAVRNAEIFKKLGLLLSTNHSAGSDAWTSASADIPVSIPAMADFLFLNSFAESLKDMDDSTQETRSQPDAPSTIKYVALFNFIKENEEERDLLQGEVVTGKASEENPEWFWVDIQGHEGYVPMSHLQLQSEFIMLNGNSNPKMSPEEAYQIADNQPRSARTFAQTVVSSTPTAPAASFLTPTKDKPATANNTAKTTEPASESQNLTPENKPTLAATNIKSDNIVDALKNFDRTSLNKVSKF